MRKISCLLVTLSMLLSFFLSSNVYAVTNSESLYNALQKKAILDNQPSEYVKGKNGIDLTEPSSVTNGMGLYTIASTTNKTYPIHYYRGDIDDNNVVFAGACWKIVRTSETGGIKLIYNREAYYNGRNYNCSPPPVRSTNSYNDDLYYEDSFFGYMEGDIDLYDVSEILDLDNHEYMSFDLNSLIMEYNNHTYQFFSPHHAHYYYSDTVRYDNGTYTLVDPRPTSDFNNSLGEVNINQVVHKYTCLNEETSCDDIAYIADYGSGDLYYALLHNGDSYDEAKAKFEKQLKDEKFYIAKDIEWNKNNNSFKLIEPQEENFYNLILGLNEGKNFGVNYHYLASKTNGSYSQDDPTSIIYYVSDIDRKHFLGELSEEYKDYLKFNVLEVPFGITMDSLRQELFETNKKESQVKKDIDLWYEQNIKDYAKYLEDTVWYNDRANNRFLVTNNLSTTSPYISYNIDDVYYNFEVDKRIYEDKIPSLKYPVLADKFTVSDKIGNGKLKYPIGLITADEVMYAAGIKVTCEGDDGHDGNHSYLARNMYDERMLTMSPKFIFQEDGFLHKYEDCGGEMSINYEVNNYEIKPIVSAPMYEVLPMISLKNTVLLESGTGVENDPYVIAESYDVKYEYTGDVPENAPNMKTEGHKAKDEVTLPSAPEIKGYRFAGWETEDVTIKDNQFVMPEKDVTIKMRYVKLNSGLVPETLDSTYTYMITFVIGIIGLAIALIINKRRQINLN